MSRGGGNFLSSQPESDMSGKFGFNTKNKSSAVPDATRHHIRSYAVPSTEVLAVMQPGEWLTGAAIYERLDGAALGQLAKQLRDMWLETGTVKRRKFEDRIEWSRR